VAKDDVIVEVKKKMISSNHSLNTFLLKPEGLKGEALFDHILAYCDRNLGIVEPSASLQIDLDNTQKMVIVPTESCLR